MSFTQDFEMNLPHMSTGDVVGVRLEVEDEFSQSSTSSQLGDWRLAPYTGMLDGGNFSGLDPITFDSDWTVFPDHDSKGWDAPYSPRLGVPSTSQPSPCSSFTESSISPNFSPFQWSDGCSTAPSTPHSHAFPSPAVQNAVMSPSASVVPQNLFQNLVSAPNVNSFTCTYPGCGKKYKTKNNLQRHRRDSKHSPSPPSTIYGTQCINSNTSSLGQPAIEIAVTPDTKKYDCPHPDCPRKGENAFLRKDNMIQHQRLVHNACIAKRKRGKQDGVLKR